MGSIQPLAYFQIPKWLMNRTALSDCSSTSSDLPLIPESGLSIAFVNAREILVAERSEQAAWSYRAQFSYYASYKFILS